MKIRRKTSIPNAVNHAAGGACNAVRLSYAAVSELTVFNGRTTAQQAVTDVSATIGARVNPLRTDVSCIVSAKGNIAAWSKR